MWASPRRAAGSWTSPSRGRGRRRERQDGERPPAAGRRRGGRDEHGTDEQRLGRDVLLLAAPPLPGVQRARGDDEFPAPRQSAGLRGQRAAGVGAGGGQELGEAVDLGVVPRGALLTQLPVLVLEREGVAGRDAGGEEARGRGGG